MKHYKIIIMPSAEDGLFEIGEYIALDNPIRAITFIDEIKKSLKNNLSLFPYSGKVVEELDLGEEIRVWSHGSYNSYYRVLDGENTVEVLFIFNASRDIGALITSL